MGTLCCRSGNLEKYSGGTAAAEGAADSKKKTAQADKLWNPAGDRAAEGRPARSITYASFTQGGKPDVASQVRLATCTCALPLIWPGSQDEMLSLHQFGGDASTHLFAVFDGHGEFGGDVCEPLASAPH